MAVTTYCVYDAKNNLVERFAGPFRLAGWAELPEGWGIEEFYGSVSRGIVNLDYVRNHANELFRERVANLPVTGNTTIGYTTL